jgi:SNF2 family DNA or RNA helicase
MTSTSATTSKTQYESLAQPWKPLLHHRLGVQWLLKHGSAGLWLDPGLGKTSISLKAFSILREEGIAERALVVAPLRPMYMVWPAEIEKWQQFNHLRYSILHDAHKDEALEAEADMYFVNPDGLDWLCDPRRMKQLDADVLIVDESSKFKHTNTQRFKLLKEYLPRFKRRWALTGSPNPNGYLDLFGQLYLLDLGKSLGSYVTHYRTKYFYSTGFGGYEWKLQEGAEQKIQKAIKPYILRLDAADYIELPRTPPPNVIRVEMPAKARKVYDEMEEEMITVLQGGHTVKALSAGSASGKCWQIANGGLYYKREDELRNRPKQLHDAKTDALVDLVEELQGGQLLVAYWFKHDLMRIEAAMKKVLGKQFAAKFAVLGGGTIKRDLVLQNEWNSGQLQIMAGHPQSVGHGLNLQRGGNHVAFYSLLWDYELYDQFIRRILRSGCKHAAVHVHHFVTSQTTDEAMMRALSSKHTTQKQLLDALRTYAKVRKR